MTTSLPFVLANHGFALNFNPFETNLINLVLVIVLLVYFLKGFLGNILERRREAILADLKDACLLYTSPSPRDKRQSRMPSSA